MPDPTTPAPAPVETPMTPEELRGQLSQQIIDKARDDGSFLKYIRKVNEKRYGGSENGVLNERNTDKLQQYLEVFERIEDTSTGLADVYSQTLFKEMGGASEQVAQYIKEYLSTEAIERPDNFLDISNQLTEYVNLPGQIQTAETELSKYNEESIKKIEAQAKSEVVGAEIEADIEKQTSQEQTAFLERTGNLWDRFIKRKAIKRAQAELDTADAKFAVANNKLDQAQETVGKCQGMLGEMQNKQSALAEMNKRLDNLSKKFTGVIGPIKQVKTMALEQAREDIMEGFEETHTEGKGRNKHEVTEETADFDKLTTGMNRHQEISGNKDLMLDKDQAARDNFAKLQNRFREILKIQTTEAIYSTDFSANSSLGQLEASLAKYVNATEGKPEERKNLITVLEGIRSDMFKTSDKDQEDQQQKRFALGMVIVDLKRRK